MNATKKYRAAWLLMIGLAACDPGLVEAYFKFEDGRAPNYAPELNATIVAWAEERLDSREPGKPINARVSIPYRLGPFSLDTIPYGTNRMIVVEVHVGNRVAFYAFSERFNVARGDHLLVPVFVPPTMPPQGVPPELGASLAVVTSTIARGYVNQAGVELSLFAEERATKVRLSNVVGLPEEKSISVDLATLESIEGAPTGYRGYRYSNWNLDRDVEPCVDDNRCRREVVGEFIDEYGYAGVPVQASVIVDRRPPSLIEDLTDISPSVVREDGHVVVSLTASEPIMIPELEIAQRVEFPFALVSPNDGLPSATYVFTSSRAAGTIGRDDTFRIRANLRDIAGNHARLVEVGSFKVDTVALMMSDVRVDPERINGEAGRVVRVFFALNKVARYDVMIDGLAVDHCVEAEMFRVTCERAMRGDELSGPLERVVTVSIDAEDEAGHVASANDTLVFDFKPPLVYAATFTPEATRAGDATQLYIASDEPLEESYEPELEYSGLAAPFAHMPSRATDFERYYELSDTTNLAAGEYELAAIVLRDKAGNESRSSMIPGVLPARWLYDPDAPAIEDLMITVRDGANVDPPRVPDLVGTRIDITFTERERYPAGGRVILLGMELACMIAGSAPTRAWSCSLVTTGDEFGDVEATENLLIELWDEASNQTTHVSPIIFDYHAADIVAGSVSLQLDPSPQNLIRRIPRAVLDVDRVGLGTTAFLSFLMDEPLQQAPVISTTPNALSFALTQQAAASFTYEYTLTSTALAQGAHTIEVTATDIAGNTATRTLVLPAPGLVIDTVPPLEPPDTMRIWHERIPWGSDATGNGATALVEGDPGAVEGDAAVAILASPSLASFDLLGSTRADAQGGFAQFALDRTEDRVEIFAVGIDSAGNWSPSTTGAPYAASRVRNGAWTASLRGKVPGQSTPNPHEVRVLRAVEPTLAQVPDMIHELDATELARIAATDGVTLSATTIRRWEEMTLSFEQPTPRERAAMAYDTMRGRGVLFGGFGLRTSISSSPEVLGDTFEWDGRRWLAMNPSGTLPSARDGHAMVYDALIGRVVMFGGCGPSTPPNKQTWLYDGTRWQELPGAAPAALSERCRHAMAYDSDRGLVLLFGGSEGSGVLRNDLWSFDGTMWTLVEAGGPASSGRPAPRADAAMIFVPGSAGNPGRLVLRGGTANGVDPLAGAWEWNGLSWSSISTSLPARHGATYVYDPVRNVRVFFGGLGPVASDELWTDNTRYVATNDPPPSRRAFAAGAFDFAQHGMVIFGGRDASGNLLDDTWAFKGSGATEGWRDVTSYSPDVPTPRSDHAMTYDGARHQMIVFGGRDVLQNINLHDETWLWNGARWLRGPVGSQQIVPREGHAMARDGSSCIVLYGGDNNSLGYLDNTQLWFLADWWLPNSSQCNSIASSEPSPARRDAAMASVGLTTILFGGFASNGLLGDTWERSGFNDRQWVQRSGGGPINPAARQQHAMATRNSRIVLFGGVDSTETVLADVWEWDVNSTQWTEVLPNGSQPTRYDHAMAEDAHRGRAVMFGGRDDTGRSQQDTWEWDGASWTELVTQRSPDARAQHALASDPDRARLVLFGGAIASSEIWELHSDPNQRPGIEVSFDWSPVGVDSSALRMATVQFVAGGRGYSDAVSTPGAELALWNARVGRWETRSSNVALPTAPIAILPTFSSPANISALVTWDRRVRVLLRPRAGIGRGPGTGEVVADGAELRVTYEFAD